MGMYIDKMEFHKYLKEYKETKSDRSYEKIGEYFLMIATNYLNKPFYINYTKDRKDDMISEAVYDMIRYIDNYDVNKMEEYIKDGKTPDPFSYFSQYVYNGVMRYIAERKKHSSVLVSLPFIENMDRYEQE